MDHPLVISHSDLARLVGALFLAMLGTLIAVTLACAIFAPNTTTIIPTEVGGLEWAAKSWGRQDFHEDREKIFYALTLLFGGIGGFLGARWRVAGDRPTFLSAILLIASVPVLNEIIRRSMESDALTTTRYAALGAAGLLVSILVSRLAARFSWSANRIKQPIADAGSSPSGRTMEELSSAKVALVFLLAVATIALLLIPIDAAAVARSIGYEMHMGLYMIGPATYRFAKGLVPGIDYYTQYSIGTPWLFSYFLGPTADRTMINAVWFEVAEMAFFEITLFAFLWWFLRSWVWALVLTVAILLTQFTTPDPLYAPSSTASRYPLLMLVALLFIEWMKRGLTLLVMPLLALALAGSLFLNTETGIYASGAVAIAAIATVPAANWLFTLRQVLLLGAMTFIAFMLLSALAFGPGVFDVHFLAYLTEPMLLYGSGFGAFPLDWRDGWHWLYNIVAPGVTLATVGWAAIVARRPDPPFPRERLAALIFVSLAGLFLSAKYINMSLVSLWQVNCFGFLIVLAWWVRVLLDTLNNRPLITKPFVLRLGSLFAAGFAALLFAWLLIVNDPRGPGLHAIASYRTLPTAVNRVFGIKWQKCTIPRTGCASRPLDSKDVALIQRLSKPGDRVAILDLQDWLYLVEAKRASKLFVQPGAMIFTQRQLRESLRDLDLIFLPRTPVERFGIQHDNVAEILVPQFKDKKFELVEEGAYLLAWKRVDKGS